MMLKLTAAVALCAGAPALAGFATIDFSTEDDFLTPLVNGQEIDSPGEFGTLFTITSPTDRLAIFDTSDPGPNSSGGDPDLLVNLGNALIIQNPGMTGQTVPGVFNTPNDDAGGGTIVFDFLTPAGLGSVDLVDINGGGQQVTITLTDDMGRTRVYDVPSLWTNDIDSEGPDGYDTLSLLATTPQLGEGGSSATVVSETLGYDPSRVVQARFAFAGSGALDNLRIDSIVPAPGAAALLGLAGVFARRRRA